MPFTPSDMADYTACLSAFNRRNGIINRVRGAARASATQALRRDMVAMAAGDASPLVVAPNAFTTVYIAKGGSQVAA